MPIAGRVWNRGHKKKKTKNNDDKPSKRKIPSKIPYFTTNPAHIWNWCCNREVFDSASSIPVECLATIHICGWRGCFAWLLTSAYIHIPLVHASRVVMTVMIYDNFMIISGFLWLFMVTLWLSELQFVWYSQMPGFQNRGQGVGVAPWRVVAKMS